MSDPSSDIPAFRYDSNLASRIELKWQAQWKDNGVFEAPNPAGELSRGFQDKPKLFVMDMFPYPSGSGLNVGHPQGFIGTDV
jgi:leucyl-tRNA synthetase